MDTSLRCHNLGYPRIGAKRELKKSLEAYWADKTSQTELLKTAATLRTQNWIKQSQLGIDWIPSNDFSFYDQVLDMCALFGVVPQRFNWDRTGNVGLDTYFAMARGADAQQGVPGASAMEMTKWFDTNYHYLVPEFDENQPFQLASTKPVDEFNEALALGIRTVPVLLGPVSFLLLGKSHHSGTNDDDTLDTLLTRLLPVYASVLETLSDAGAEWVQIDEPCLATELTAKQKTLFSSAYQTLSRCAHPKIMLAVYFGALRDNLPTACCLPVQGLHIDAVRAPEEVEAVASALHPDTLLSLGIVDGRNIWRNDYAFSLSVVREARRIVGSERLLIAPSCSLLHVPCSLEHETQLESDLKSWLAFADEKLTELAHLAQLALCDDINNSPAALRQVWDENQMAIESRRKCPRVHDEAVGARVQAIAASDIRRASPFAERRLVQQNELNLPLFPTTTIGSFPQTKDVRSARARYKSGLIDRTIYDNFLSEQMRDAVLWQEEVGLDVLVHGEFERNDMVEYFGEQLSGFAFTENGWVQSYGSRCVKPPIIFGDVSRPHPMTVRWATLAQSLTTKPMKGMLTGPVTILQWSFVRDDQPRSVTTQQIALALRDEVRDLETAGIRIIQVDEPALREGLPLRRSEWANYLTWAIEAFRLATSGVSSETQIHTHMCYCEFNDIIESIAALDADVISIETTRSQSELLGAFVQFNYPNAIGPGVWDIHSPRVPSSDEMGSLLRASAEVIAADRLWVNPDCGLKTRSWDEVRPAIQHMVNCASAARDSYNTEMALAAG